MTGESFLGGVTHDYYTGTACLKKWYGDAHHCKKWCGVRRTSRTFYAAPEVALINACSKTLISSKRSLGMLGESWSSKIIVSCIYVVLMPSYQLQHPFERLEGQSTNTTFKSNVSNVNKVQTDGVI